VRQAIEDNREYARPYGVTFQLDDRTSGVRVEVDGPRLVQVLTNLLSNAAKYSPQGGAVVVRMDVPDGQDGPLDGQEPVVRVSVRDEGAGVPEEFRARIFDRFSQADSSDSRMRGGTGLGLAIAKELLERMHGSIGYQPDPRGGSVFWFTLPIVGRG
jgi:signal transduction histidine kinase